MDEKLEFLLESQYWSYNKLKNYQFGKIQKMIKYAYDNVPYYKSIFNRIDLKPNNIQNFDDFFKIPILTKNKIQNNYEDITSDIINNLGTVIDNYTGGSTGQPLRFKQDQNYLEWANAARSRAWKYWGGSEKSSREAVLWGAERDMKNNLGLKDVLKIFFKKNDIKLNTFNVNKRSYERFIRLCNIYKPKTIRAYTSSVVELAKYIENNNKHFYSPNSIIASAEVLTKKSREYIQSIINTKVLNSYGCREVSQIAMECRQQDGLHVVMENNYVEIFDKKIIVTNLHNLAMPFIRYEIGDKSDGFITSKCKCGRNLIRIKNVKGRVSDVIKINKYIIHAEWFTHLFYGAKKISRYQILNKKSQKIIILLVDVFEQEIWDKIKKETKVNFPNIEVKMKVTDWFYKTKTGKLKFVINEEEICEQ